jgi:type II secretory pathway component PulM
MINRVMQVLHVINGFIRQMGAGLSRPFRWLFAKMSAVLMPIWYQFKNQLTARLSPVFLPIWQRGIVIWQNLAPREQKVIGIGFVLVLACLFWLLVWDPLYQAKQRALKQLPLVQAQHMAVIQSVAIIQAQGGAKENTPISQQQIVDAFRERGLEVETSSGQEDRVWRLSIKQASWADFYQIWRKIALMDESIQIESLRLERIGTVDDEEKSKKIAAPAIPSASPLGQVAPDGLFVVNVSFIRVPKS